VTHPVKRYGTSTAERPDGIFCLYAEYEKVVAECEAFRADAAKYRWIRGGEKDVFCVIGSNGPWGECGHQEIYDDRLDETIDAARAEEKA
jgi:hypothetical protein